MRYKATTCFALISLSLVIPERALAVEPSWWTAQKTHCRLPPNLAYNNWNGQCNSSGNAVAPTYDNGAAQRAQEAAEAAAEAQRQQDADLEQQRIEAESKRRMEEIANQAKFINDRDAAARTLRGSTGSAAVGGTGEYGLRGSSATTELRGLTATPTTAQAANLDPMVVDARHVRSGLPKSIDTAIATAYSGAPPGVSDRVRKGFQAVAAHDWKLAKAWFMVALNYDPNDAGLKRLIELSDYTEKHIPHGKTRKATPRPAQRAAVQFPQDSDMELLFPDLKPKTKPSSADDGNSMDLPLDSDIELLFPGRPAKDAKTLSDYVLDQATERTASDPVLMRVSDWLRNRNPRIPKN